MCSFGSDLGQGPCNDVKCAVCNICRESFDISRARTVESGGTPAMHLRFGNGTYFAPDSSKSHSYNQDSHRDLAHGQYRVMFLCKVAIGHAPYQTEEGGIPIVECEALIQRGHTSIIGRVGPHLNYEEVVVYNSAAAIPSYLIVYKM